MNNIELFIKYEQDLLNKKDKEKFEIKLKSSSEFQEEYNSYRKKLNSLSVNVDVDEQYFINLLPNVRNNILKQKSFFNVRKISYAIPVFLIAWFLTFQFGNDKGNFNYNFNEWFNTFTDDEEVMTDLFVDVLSIDDTYLLLGNDFEEYNVEVMEPTDEEVQNGSLDNYIHQDAIKEDFIQQFTEDQFNEVYSILINKKIL